MLRVSSSLLFVLAFTACSGPTGPATIQVYGLDPSTGQYGFYDATLTTLTDATTMAGSIVTMEGDATIVLDSAQSVTSDNPVAQLQAQGGSPPKCSFTSQGGVLYPNDFDSLAMASGYAALERARAMYDSLGAGSGLNTVPAYYNPNVQAITDLVPTFWLLTDNAAYAASFDGFLIVPQVILQDVPFDMNQGVMTHEYGHKVHNHLVDLDARNPHWQADGWTAAAATQYRSIDEGIQDVMGGTLTGDPNFIEPSIAHETAIPVDRDMSKDRIIDACQTTLALGSTTTCVETDGGSVAWDPHVTGAYVAAALWQLGVDQGDHTLVAQTVIDTEKALGTEIGATTPKPYDYGIVLWFNHFLSQLPASSPAIADLCSLVQTRFAILLTAEAANSPEHHLDPTLCPGAP